MEMGVEGRQIERRRITELSQERVGLITEIISAVVEGNRDALVRKIAGIQAPQCLSQRQNSAAGFLNQAQSRAENFLRHVLT